MKTCVSSYSFRDLLASGEYTQLTLLSLAKEMGFDAIEYTDLTPPAGVQDVDYAAQLKAESEKIGLPIINYTIGADFLNADSFDAQVEHLFHQVDVAAALGATGMRHDATGGYRTQEKSYKSFAQALPVLADGCRRVTQYAKNKGIQTMVENHGFFCQESARVESLVTAVADENFGLLVDVGNFACADDPSFEAVGRLAAFAKHVHVKDFHIKDGNGIHPGEGFFCSRGGRLLRGAIIGHGDIPVVQCLRTLHASGYKGYVSIEFEGMEEPKKALAIGLANLKRFIAIAAD